MKRTPMKRTAFRKEGPSVSREAKPRAEAKVEPRTCAMCPRQFIQRSSLHTCCSQRCAMRKGKADKAAKDAKEKADFKARKEAVETIPKLIAKAQAAFNAYIRARDVAKGCFVCGRPFNQNVKGQAIHAGHVRSRGAAGHLRFVEDNCMGECEGCNAPHGAKPHEKKAGAIARIGAARFAELEADNEPHKWTHAELRGLIATYRAKLKALKATHLTEES